MDHLDEQWQREAQRLHERYVIEIVEACGLCPWAERCRVQGRSAAAVLLHFDDLAFGPATAIIDEWAAGRRVDVGFFIFPRLQLDRREFDFFVARLRNIEAKRHPIGEAPFVLAAFHPNAPLDLQDPERLVPYLRRTPDPCIQALRMSTLRRMRSGTAEGTHFVDLASLEAGLSSEERQPLRERIARANLETIRRMGAAQLATRIEDIQRDRDVTYAVLRGR